MISSSKLAADMDMESRWGEEEKKEKKRCQQMTKRQH